jgi:hypothetical protein
MYTVLRALRVFALTLWLSGLVLACFVAPLYLLAIYPELPESFGRGFGRAMSGPALQNFWYRLLVCALFVGLGLIGLLATLKARTGSKPRSRRQSAA